MPCHLVLQLSSSKHLKTNKNNKKTSSHAQVIPENNNKKILASFYIARTSLIPKPENGPTKTNKETNKKYMLISLRSIDKKVSREIKDLKKQDLN